jgi:hypothetical protein
MASVTAQAQAQAMYGNPGSTGHGPAFGPGTVPRKMVYIWAASGLWLFFVGWAARSY